MCGGFLASGSDGGSDGGAPDAPLLPHAAALISACRIERKEIRIGNFSLDGSSHQTGDAAFTPATPHDLHHSSQVNTLPKQRAKPAASRTRTCTNAAVCIASGKCPSRF